MKPPAASPTATSTKRQTSLAGFFTPAGSAKKSRTEAAPRPVGRDDDDEPVAIAGPSSGTKRKLGSAEDSAVVRNIGVEEETPEERPSPTDEDTFINYPPRTHPSYRLPPRPDYNHPIPIMPPPPSLISSLRFNTSPRIITSPADLDLLYFNRFIDPSGARQLTKYLLEAMPWYRVNYRTRMGQDIKTPRYTTVFGKDATPLPWDQYPKWSPRAIPEILLRLMQKVEQVTGETYNFSLVNYYSSGTDSISYHSDSERFLGPNPCIASISLGAPRDFFLRHTEHKTNGLPVQKFNLHDGDMVVMRGKTQHKWEHSIPKRAKAEGRINITFRKGVVQYATENYLTYNVGTGPMFRWEGGKMVEKGYVG